MTFINLTPHEVIIMSQDHIYTRRIKSSGGIARIITTFEQIGTIDDIPVMRAASGTVIGLPGPVPGVAYIVSAMVLQAVPGRVDVFAPDTAGSAVRDEGGRITAVTRLLGNSI